MEKNVKLRLLMAFFIASGFCPGVWSQENHTVQVFGGYSYLNFDVTKLTAGLLNDRLSAHGWDTSVSFDVNHWFGLEADLSGHYKGNCEGVSGLTCKDLSFMGGPRFAYRKDRYTAFAHGLFGGDNGSGSISGLSLSDTPFAMAFGGGIDYQATPRIALRVAQFDYFYTRHALNLGASPQNNYRVAAGVVLRFGAGVPWGGSHHWPSNYTSESTASRMSGSVQEAILLGITGAETENGVKVVSVRPASPAAVLGIQPGDFISTIDGRQVRNSHDIESGIALNATGTIKVSYLIRGAWLTEKEVKVK